MRMIFADIETFFSKEYSLRHLTVPEYVLDPRFELICVSAQVDDGPIQFIDGPDFATWLKQFDPADTIMVCYNSLFDSCAIAWRYHFVPARLIDVLGMARCLLGHKLRRLSLDAVSKHLNAGEKGDAVHTVVGMNRQNIINAGLWPAYAEYNRQDVRILKAIFNKLAPTFSKAEYRLMDLVLRCAVQPQFVADLPRLEAHLKKVRADKEQLLASANVEKAQLMSAAAFVALLEAEGVEVETKISGTGNEIPAVAKTDRFMTDLAEHENPRVQALAAARLGHKSTIDETRTERLIAIARLPWSA
jgi:hypothetical protein